jgi:hypothetical protein
MSKVGNTNAPPVPPELLRKLSEPRARELVDKLKGPPDAKGGWTPSAAELKELHQLLSDLERHDGFKSDVKKELTDFLKGDPKVDPKKLLATMAADLQKLLDPRAVSRRFSDQYPAMRTQLAQNPSLEASQRLNQLFEAFSKFAVRFVALAGEGAKGELEAQAKELLQHGEAASAGLYDTRESNAGQLPQPLSTVERLQELERFLDTLKALGFDKAVEVHTGQAGLDAAREVLQATTAQDASALASQKQFEPAEGEAVAANRPESEAVARESASLPAGTVRGGEGKGAVEGMREHSQLGDLSDPAARRRARDGVLGKNMVWNILHRYREGGRLEGEESMEERDTWNRLMVAAALILLGGAIIVVVVVNL